MISDKKDIKKAYKPTVIYGLETATLTKRAFGHLQERDSGFTGQKMLNMELEEKRQPMRFVEAVKEEMQRVGLTEYNGTDGLKGGRRSTVVILKGCS